MRIPRYCAKCRYDMVGLHRLAPCPECGERRRRYPKARKVRPVAGLIAFGGLAFSNTVVMLLIWQLCGQPWAPVTLLVLSSVPFIPYAVGFALGQPRSEVSPRGRTVLLIAAVAASIMFLTIAATSYASPLPPQYGDVFHPFTDLIFLGIFTLCLNGVAVLTTLLCVLPLWDRWP